MSAVNEQRPSPLREFLRDFPVVWKAIPCKGLFTFLLVIWVLLFELLGNSTLGYIRSHSLFAWTNYSYACSPDDEHGLFIPVVVLILFWMRRKEFEPLQARLWWPGLVLVGIALGMHLLGYLIQQTRISLAAFFLGLYALIGLVWGPKVFLKAFFPMCLFAFALPLGTIAESITQPLRLIATKFTTIISTTGLGIDVIQRGTQLTSPNGTFQYEVAAACSGLRSLTAVLALCTIYSFMNFNSPGRRVIMIASAFPLAIAGNVLRLLAIIIASEAFGQKWGEWVHDSTLFSMLPYVPAIGGILVMGWLLKEKPSKPVEPPMGLEQPA